MHIELFRAFLRFALALMVLAWVAAIASLVSSKAFGDELHLLDPTYLAMEGYDVKNNRNDYLAIDDQGSTKYGSGETWKYGAAVRFNYDLIRYDNFAMYWNNHVHMAATEVAVRHVGWEFETGFRLGKHIDTFYYHHSEHVMDLEREARHFPLQNLYGIRFVLIEKGRK